MRRSAVGRRLPLHDADDVLQPAVRLERPAAAEVVGRHGSSPPRGSAYSSRSLHGRVASSSREKLRRAGSNTLTFSCSCLKGALADKRAIGCAAVGRAAVGARADAQHVGAQRAPLSVGVGVVSDKGAVVRLGDRERALAKAERQRNVARHVVLQRVDKDAQRRAIERARILMRVAKREAASEAARKSERKVLADVAAPGAAAVGALLRGIRAAARAEQMVERALTKQVEQPLLG
eukprot:6206912-Pleurochrysis_carterae.AAC.2